jgi:hypothetical protein
LSVNLQNEIKEKIYRSYFIDGLDIGDIDVLLDIAKQNNIQENVVKDFINENKSNTQMTEFNKPLHQGVRGLQQLTLQMIAEGQSNPHFLAAGATDYCRYFGNVLLAYMWARIAKVCLDKQDDQYYVAKLASARFFFKRIFPETLGLAAKIQAGHKTLMDYPVEMM